MTVLVVALYVVSYRHQGRWAGGTGSGSTVVLNAFYFPARSVHYRFLRPSETSGWIGPIDFEKRQLEIGVSPTAGLIVEFSPRFERTLRGFRRGEKVSYELGVRPELTRNHNRVFLREIQSAETVVPSR